MGTNIDIDAEQIKTSTVILDRAVGDIPQQLTQLKNSVDSLLNTPEGGLFLTQSSPAFQHAYEQFNTSLLNAVQGIATFSKQFTSIAASVQGMDESIAKAVNGH